MTRPPSFELTGSLLIDEAAAALGVSRRTIYYRIQQGRLATIRTRGGSQRVLRSSMHELRPMAVVPAACRIDESPER